MYVDPRLLLELDDRLRADLTTAHDLYFKWLLIFTALVLVGVVLEAPEAIHAARRRMRIKFPRLRYPGDDVPKPELIVEGGGMINRLSLVGLLVLVVGLAGEGTFEAFVMKTDAALEVFNEIMIADSFQRLSAVYTRAAELTKEAEDERLARVKIEERLAWRTVNEQQCDGIAQALKPFAGRVVRVFTVNSNLEIERFTEGLTKAFEKAHITVLRPGLMMSLGAHQPIEIDAGDNARRLAIAFVAALKREHVIPASEVITINRFEGNAELLDIKISPKPQ